MKEAQQRTASKTETKAKPLFLFYLIFVFCSNFSLLTQFLSAFLTQRGLSLSHISLLFLLYQASKFCFEIPTGYLSDRYGRRTSGQIGLLLYALSYALLWWHQPWLYALSFLAKGLGITFVSGSIESIYVESVPKSQWLRNNTIERLTFFLCLALAAFVSGQLIQGQHYSFLILFDSVLAVLVAIFLFLFPSSRGADALEEGKNLSFRVAVSTFRAKPILGFILLLDFSTAFSMVAAEALYPAYLLELGVQANWIGLFIAGQYVVAACFGLILPSLQKRLSSHWLLYALPPISILLMMPIYAFPLPSIFIPVLFTLHFLCFALYAPIKYSVYQSNVPSAYRSTLMSFTSQAIAIGAISFYLLSSGLSQIWAMKTILCLAFGLSLLLHCLACGKLWKLGA